MLASGNQKIEEEQHHEPRPLKHAHVMSLTEQLRKAKSDEIALEGHLHRVRDPKGLELLRKLRQKISDLETSLQTDEAESGCHN